MYFGLTLKWRRERGIFYEKNISIIICAVLVFLSTISTATSITSGNLDLDQLLSPYQEVIDKLNFEYNADMILPSDGKEEVYNKVKNKTVEEFEKDLRKSYETYKEAMLSISTNYINPKHLPVDTDNAIRVSAKKSEFIPPIHPLKDDVGVQSIRERIIQEQGTLVGGTVYLESEIFSATGKRGTFEYTKIYDYGSYIYNDRNHFRAERAFHKLTDSKKVCAVTYVGAIYSGDGVRLPGSGGYQFTAVYESDY